MTVTHAGGPEHRPRLLIPLLLALVVLVGLSGAAMAIWAGWSIGQRMLAPLSALPAPASFRARIAADYSTFEVETLYWASGASRAATPTLVAWLRSTETSGFRHIAELDYARGPGASGVGTLTAPWEYFFNSRDELNEPGPQAAFERLWVGAHPELACGWVGADERAMPDPLTGYQAESYSITATGALKPEATFWYRFNWTTQGWDTDVATTAPRPLLAISVKKAHAVVTHQFPAFRVVEVVRYPAIVGHEIGDVFVVLRYPGAPGFLYVRDPLADTPEDPYALSDYQLDGPFFGHLDTQRTTFMRDWVKAHPGTVVAGFETFGYTGNSLDYLNVEYFPSLAAVATDETLLDALFNYDATRKRWAPAK